MQPHHRIHITGASCAGVTTLGRALSRRLDLRHVDVDDFYWMPTDPPFTTKRSTGERVDLILRALGEDGWILSGSFDGWGDTLIADVGLIVFLTTPTPVRMQRLVTREKERYGERISPGGDMHEIHVAFRDWASQYDTPGFLGRNRLRHEYWLAEQVAPVVRLEGTTPVENLADAVIAELDETPV